MPIQLTHSNCELVRKLGCGSSGSVWLARIDGSEVALKVGETGYREYLATEAERLLLCSSPHLPRPLDVGELPVQLRSPDGELLPRGAPYLVLTYTPGRDLRHWLAQTPNLELAWAVARDVSRALSDLHGAGFAHGDIKPDNIVALASDDGFACGVIDLGLSEAADASTAVGGTPRYLAPETKTADRDGDARARDLWALGLTLLELSVEGARAATDPREALSSCPKPLQHIVGALLQPHPGARPSAAWVASRTTEGVFEAPRVRAVVERSYLASRKHALARIARGFDFRVEVTDLPGQWLETTAATLQRISRLRGTRPADACEALSSLSEAEQRRWLLGLVGPTIVDFPPLPPLTDAQLVERLLQLCDHRPLESLTYADICEGLSDAVHAPPTTDEELVLLLGAEAPPAQVLLAAEERVLSRTWPAAVVVALARALRRRHEIPRAVAVLATTSGSAAQLEAATCAVRLGDLESAHTILQALLASDGLEETIWAAACALTSRLALLRGDDAQAEALLTKAPESVKVLEARASIELTRGHLEAAKRTLDRALSFAHDAEDRARVEALLANWSQQAGAAEQALEQFRRAAEHAARAGALLEEATYLSGVASTAANAGQLAVAVAAAERSALLFRHLGRPEAASRAVLSKASALGASGAAAEAAQAARESLSLSKRAHDERCQAYAHFVLADVLESVTAREHVERAATLLTDAREDDQLHVLSRRLRLGLIDDVAAGDKLAQGATSADARVEWWGMRARAALESGLSRSEPILTQLSALANSPAAVSARAPAFAYGTQLAADTGDADTARRLAQAASDALAKLRQGISPSHRVSFEQLEWTKLLRAKESSNFNPEQLADIETLIHGLGERENLKTLLNRVLDALTLWTSVERGLLLLTAPGGKLVPRAGRNLGRADLKGEQLKLSTTLAQRALDERECIVAVDAAGEMSDVVASVHSLKLRSVLAVPLLARGQVVGVAYLDDRMRRGAFGKQELAWVRLVSTLAAVAIAETKDQLLLRRAVRKARRAERKVTQLLARREVELLVAEQELARTRDRATRYAYDDIIGTSPPMQQMLRLVDRVTPSDIPVLVLGESGSGKELVARAIHFNGPRKKAPFVTENCSAIPETLLESTLFGHVKGAFTGAARHHAGLFEVAHRGTLFLDEIADMSLGMQGKLLRALESGEIRRVGSERSIKVDVRIIGATHKDLEAMVRRGTFRQDLYYRLNVITVQLPTLRERPEDIPLLVRHFLNKYAGSRSVELTTDALSRLRAHPWTGNVRQLENEIRRALVLADDRIELTHLSPSVVGTRTPQTTGLDLRQHVDALEVDLVQRALQETKGNQTKTAQLLGVSRFGLQKMIRRLDIDIAAVVERTTDASTA